MKILPSSRFLLFFMLEILTVLSNEIDEKFLRVTQYCPESLSAFGEILILSGDANLSPYALCRGIEYNFIQISPAVYRLRFRHFGDPNKNCISTLVPREDSFTVRVNIPTNTPITLHTENQIVKCRRENPQPPLELKLTNSEDLIFQSNQTTMEQNQTDWNDLLQADPLIELDVKEAIRINIQVHEVDNYNNSAKIQIYTLMNNPPVGIPGVSPIKCVISNYSEAEDIIDNGCSNGSIIPVDTGFQVEGIISLSPAFWFPIPIENLIFVSCSFGICKNKCDGSSCRDHNIEVTGIYNTSTAIDLTTFHDRVRDFLPNWEDVGVQSIPASRPPLQNDPVDKDAEPPTTEPPRSYFVTLNIPLIIALSVLLPITSFLLIAVFWYRSKVNSGAYRVRNGTDL